MKLPPAHIRAAAELELRRRQKERSANCFFCALSESTSEIYDGEAVRPDPCPHILDQQDIGSSFNQNLLDQMEAIYGDAEPMVA